MADVAQALERLQHGGRGVARDGADELGLHLVDGCLDLGELKDVTPLLGDDGDVAAHTRGDLGQQRAKAAGGADEHLVAGGDDGNERALDGGTRGTIDHQGLITGALKV